MTFNFGKDGWNKLPDVKKEIQGIAKLPGANVYVAGPGGQAADSAEVFSGIDGKLLWSTVIVVVVILLLTYRSPILWILPVLSAGVALTTAQGVIYLLAKNAGLTVNGQSQGILTVLVFGAGTDYALLLVARYREELRRHGDRHEAMAFALHRAAPAIVASGLTVILGMLCLVFAGHELHRGPRAGRRRSRIRVGLLVMITLLLVAARDHRPLDLLAAAARPSPAPTSRPPPASGPRSVRASRRARAWSGSARPPRWPCAASASCRSTPTACRHQDAYTKAFDSAVDRLR